MGRRDDILTMTRGEVTTLMGRVASVAMAADHACMDWDHGDPWGSTMTLWFECAEELTRRGEDVPEEWDYRAGLGIGETVSEYAGIPTASVAWLRYAGNSARELSHLLRDYAFDY